MKFYANPYKYGLTGFYFSTFEDYESQLNQAQEKQCSDYEHEVEVIDGDNSEFTLYNLVNDSYSKWDKHYQEWEELDEHQQSIVEFLVLNVGYEIEEAFTKLEELHYVNETAKDYAYTYAEEAGLQGLALQYFDCEAFARDCTLNGDWIELAEQTITITNLNSI